MGAVRYYSRVPDAGVSPDNLRELPEEPRRVVGYAVYQAQLGELHAAAKRLKGEFAGLVEIVDDFDGNTYRGVYTTKLAGVVYVLRGALRGQEKRLMAIKTARRKRTTALPVTRGSGNVYADLGFANPAEELAKADLARMICQVIRDRDLTQQQAATLMAIDQPKVSHLLRGRLGGYSLERLMDFLTALGRDVEIVVRPAPPSRKRGRVHVVAA